MYFYLRGDYMTMGWATQPEYAFVFVADAIHPGV